MELTGMIIGMMFGFIIGCVLTYSVSEYWHNRIVKEYKIACLSWEEAYKRLSNEYLEFMRGIHAKQ